MERAIRKVAVIGAGSMGSGIAAQFANGGVPVLLLDVAGPEDDRAAPARAGVERQLKAQGFMDPSAAELVSVGSIEDDLAAVADADWIVEAVVEDLAVKRRLFARLDALRKPGRWCPPTPPPSPLAQLTEGASEAFRSDFVITHFFNPPRHMRLMELVAGPGTAPEAAALVRDAAETVLGKTVVDCRDTPAFIANRLGCHWMSVAAIEALRHGLTVEQADAVAGAPFGVPRTGIFGLLDLVGIDLVPLVWGSLLGALPAGDAHHRHDLTAEPLIRRLIAEGRIGRKAKGGFYRLAPGSKEREALNLSTGEYRPQVDAGAKPRSRGVDPAGGCGRTLRLGGFVQQPRLHRRRGGGDRRRRGGHRHRHAARLWLGRGAVRAGRPGGLRRHRRPAGGGGARGAAASRRRRR
ncbi:3-hydroxyacyl-CoA dehydrogenase family protein [Azospirillum sp. INR13]|uniref:3-hydroxyacyl-CoA dehydrogenase family protein n=1 Tax=Azospirillum sp. INR13 TaxID=2596919 RepID=UPI00351CA403